MATYAQLAGTVRHELPQKWSKQELCLHNSQNGCLRNTQSDASRQPAALHLPHDMAGGRSPT
jgi:hypothetical protein